MGNQRGQCEVEGPNFSKIQLQLHCKVYYVSSGPNGLS